jgi:hypothetical protein
MIKQSQRKLFRNHFNSPMNNTQKAIGCGSDFSVQNGGIQNGGSVFIVRAHSDECEEWMTENVGNDETQTFGGGIVVEPRYVQGVIEGLESNGFTGRWF